MTATIANASHFPALSDLPTVAPYQHDWIVIRDRGDGATVETNGRDWRVNGIDAGHSPLILTSDVERTPTHYMRKALPQMQAAKTYAMVCAGMGANTVRVGINAEEFARGAAARDAAAAWDRQRADVAKVYNDLERRYDRVQNEGRKDGYNPYRDAWRKLPA